MYFVDSHAHLDFDEYEGKRDEVIQRAREAGIQTIVSIGTRPDGWDKILGIAEQYPEVFMTVGVHPCDIKSCDPKTLEALLLKYAAHPKVVGIGETGFDFYHEPFDREAQEAIFRTHIKVAQQEDLPLEIHTRAAEEDTLRVLGEAMAENPQTKIILHCFTGSLKMAQEALALGCYLSFSGVVTFKNAKELREVVVQTPLERMLVETDSPYLSPEPYRGKPNEPSRVVYTATRIAALKELPLQEVAEATTGNFFNLFTKAQKSS